MKYFDEKFKKRIREIYYTNYKPISVEAGETLLNNKCHYNAIHHYNKNNNMKVCLVLVDGYIVHFINYNCINDKYIDNTLGVLTSESNYRLIRIIEPIEYKTATDLYYNILWETINYLNNQIPLYIKIFSKFRIK